MVVIIAVALIVVLSGKESSKNVVVTPGNVDQLINDLAEEERTPIGSYTVVMNNEWHFNSSRDNSTDAYVENNVANNNTVYFTLTMPGSDDEFYTSPYIPVGSHISNVNLGTDLDAGTYEDVVLTYHLVDSSYKEVSTTAVAITITILK